MEDEISISSLLSTDYVGNLCIGTRVSTSKQVSSYVEDVAEEVFDACKHIKRFDSLAIGLKGHVSAVGLNTFAAGTGLAYGRNSIALGGRTDYNDLNEITAVYSPSALGECSFAIGKTALASGYDSLAFGTGTAAADHSIALLGETRGRWVSEDDPNEGANVAILGKCYGWRSVAIGTYAEVSSDNSFSLGSNKISSYGSIAIGQGNTLDAGAYRNIVVGVECVEMPKHGNNTHNTNIMLGCKLSCSGSLNVMLGSKLSLPAEKYYQDNFIWNGSLSTIEGLDVENPNHRIGTFNVFPKDGLSGFYIAGKSLASYIAGVESTTIEAATDAATISATQAAIEAISNYKPLSGLHWNLETTPVPMMLSAIASALGVVFDS